MWKTVEKKRRSKRKTPILFKEVKNNIVTLDDYKNFNGQEKDKINVVAAELKWCFDEKFQNRHYYFFPSAEQFAPKPQYYRRPGTTTIFPWGLFNKKTPVEFLGSSSGPLKGTITTIHYLKKDEVFTHAAFTLLYSPQSISRTETKNVEIHVYARKSLPNVFLNQMEMNEIYLSLDLQDLSRAFFYTFKQE